MEEGRLLQQLHVYLSSLALKRGWKVGLAARFDLLDQAGKDEMMKGQDGMPV